MNIKIKTKDEIEIMREAGQLNNECRKLLFEKVQEGITTKELDRIASDFIESHNAKASFLQEGFPGSICTSINEVVVHGIPSNRKLEKGDIISVDLGIEVNGYHSDAAFTKAIGNPDIEVAKLLEGTKKALSAGIKKIKNGVKLSEVSGAVEKVAQDYNLGVVKELVGHGVGTSLQEDPNVPNYLDASFEEVELKSGMVIAIEPMFTIGAPDVWLEHDDWAISTQDGSYAAHFEHTVLVTDAGYEILTGEIE